MVTYISTIYMDAESGNVMEMTVSDGNTAAQATESPSHEHLHKQECSHGTCLVFP